MTTADKLLLFDLDGTILYSKDAIFNAINAALICFGHEPFSEDELLRNLRIPLEDKYRMKCGGDPEPLMEKFRSEYLRTYRESTYIHEGMLPLLERLKKNGIRMAVITLKEGREAEQVVREMGLMKFFSAIFGSQNPDYRPKPSPEHVGFALRSLCVDPENCALVGDMRGDIMSAKGVGVTAIGVAWCLRSPEQLVKSGADHVATEPGELEEILEKLGFL